VGCHINHLRVLWAFFSNPPDPATGASVIWTPNYGSANSYNVILQDLKVGGEGYKLDRRLVRDWGFVGEAVELTLRVLGYAT
jgi:hypothetical protein